MVWGHSPLAFLWVLHFGEFLCLPVGSTPGLLDPCGQASVAGCVPGEGEQRGVWRLICGQACPGLAFGARQDCVGFPPPGQVRPGSPGCWNVPAFPGSSSTFEG